MYKEVIKNMKEYLQKTKLDASMYVIGSGALGKEKDEIDVFIILSTPIDKLYKIQKELLEIINKTGVVPFYWATDKNRMPDKKKIHLLVHNMYYENTRVNPIFIREYLKTAKLIYGKEISPKTYPQVKYNLTNGDYIDYLMHMLHYLDNARIVIGSYEDPEKEIKERIKIIKRPIQILKEDLGYEGPEIDNIKDPYELFVKLFHYFNDMVEDLKKEPDKIRTSLLINKG